MMLLVLMTSGSTNCLLGKIHRLFVVLLRDPIVTAGDSLQSGEFSLLIKKIQGFTSAWSVFTKNRLKSTQKPALADTGL